MPEMFGITSLLKMIDVPFIATGTSSPLEPSFTLPMPKIFASGSALRTQS